MATPSLDTLPLEMFHHLLTYMKTPEHKKLRLVSSSMKHKVDQQSGRIPFKYWEIPNATADRICKFSEDVNQVKGLELHCWNGRTEELKKSTEVVLEQHPELNELGFHIQPLLMNMTEIIMMNLLNSFKEKLVKLQLKDRALPKNDQLCHQLSLPLIQVLELTGISITDVEFFKFVNATGGRLKKLDVVETRIEAESAQIAPGKLKHLKYLDLSFNNMLTDNGLTRLINATEGYILDLALNHTKMNGESLELKANKLVRLRKLSLNFSRIKNRGLEKIIQATGGSLTELNLNAVEVSEEHLQFDSGKLCYLEVLNLSGGRQLTGKGLTNMINATGGRLLELDLSGRTIHESEENFHLSTYQKLQRLKVLKLSNCPTITNEIVVNILTATGGALEELDISNSNLSLELFQYIPSTKLAMLKTICAIGYAEPNEAHLTYIKSMAVNVNILLS